MGMGDKLLWFRLTQGKVWHVATAGSPVAVCGMPVEQGRERQPKRPPFGARPCPDCADVANQAVVAIGAAEGNRFPAYAPVATAAEAAAAYEHDLTDPDGLVVDDHPKRQRLAEAEAEYRDRMEMAEGQP